MMSKYKMHLKAKESIQDIIGQWNAWTQKYDNVNNVFRVLLYLHAKCMITSSNKNIVRLTGPLWGETDRSPVVSPHKSQ